MIAHRGKTIPSWDLLGREDKAIPLATQEFMARRAHSQVVQINASHASLVSPPVQSAT
jgi:pimeloyl-ACP methyl ester carboxylesterase